MNKNSQFNIVLAVLIFLLIAFIANICLVCYILVNNYKSGPIIEKFEEIKDLDLSSEKTEIKPISISVASSSNKSEETLVVLPITDPKIKDLAIYSFQFDIVRNKTYYFQQIEPKIFKNVFNSEINHSITLIDDKITLITYLDETSASQIEIDKEGLFNKIINESFHARHKLNEIHKIVLERMVVGDLKAACVETVKQDVSPVIFETFAEALAIENDLIEDVTEELFGFLNKKFLISTDKGRGIKPFLFEEDTDPRYFLIHRLINFFNQNKRKLISVDDSIEMISEIISLQFKTYMDEFTDFMSFITHVSDLYKESPEQDVETQIQSIFIQILIEQSE